MAEDRGGFCFVVNRQGDHMRFQINTVVAALLLFLGSLQPALAAHNDPDDVAAVRQVLESFRTSIIKKDKAAFVSLFFSDKPEHVTWQFVDDDIRVARFAKFAPEARKALRVPGWNYLALIDDVTKAGALPSEEVVRNVVIDTDGEVASVNFDYSFLLNGEETNWGREMMHLVRTEDGWKIISVIFSQRDPVSKQ
jgi:hypothetical protein